MQAEYSVRLIQFEDEAETSPLGRVDDDDGAVACC